MITDDQQGEQLPVMLCPKDDWSCLPHLQFDCVYTDP